MRLVKNFLAFVIFIFSFSVFVSCGRNIDTGISENKEIRIVSLAPSNTEILVGLDLGNNIIGIDQYSEGIKGVSENIQVFEIGVPNIEAVLKLNPTHLLLSGYTSDLSKYVELENSGVKVINIDTPTSIQGIYDSIELIGKSFNSVSKSKEMIESIKSSIEDIIGNNNSEKVSVYFEISQAPYLYSFGRSTYLNEIIELSGGENIFGNLEGWISPSEESIIKANPQIIFTNVNVEGNIDEIKNRHGWENIDAVKNNRIYYIDKDMSSRASQFFLGALKDITRYIREYNDEV
ncbi:Iron compound ABC transporter, iron-binding protein [Candidatus Arthromitus sp. SFB-mouse-SU]|uniref:ABC transporter substrate-binding protein n=1 Tax=Candidatus Arthromitus sp. SFB-mouse TaxID=49118 RepID=UPI000229681C|nr:ABC transporter substrate-binding protein [Candidatus Arthromitus sp. SFB-mouse]EIA22888.1 Iron compound ABC transporter, iron-binding protein [Candidatus Arthromitus sp. SFB-1]EIA29180.1 Iron compound ABC transporter, iron-binding protein [Candidatus Arthromitus sp. SFB-co]EIA30405.1 Iron compound ABC transporter, iron-binding protein [Candidatus Arthromitus sp. SFB-mouse-SU]EIA31438.1 Iron compound ABC transporter, iron-binding protein [Candidatus Arthromitus sp. SFB-5]EGX29192.1 iron com